MIKSAAKRTNLIDRWKLRCASCKPKIVVPRKSEDTGFEHSLASRRAWEFTTVNAEAEKAKRSDSRRPELCSKRYISWEGGGGAMRNLEFGIAKEKLFLPERNLVDLYREWNFRSKKVRNKNVLSRVSSLLYGFAKNWEIGLYHPYNKHTSIRYTCIIHGILVYIETDSFSCRNDFSQNFSTKVEYRYQVQGHRSNCM